MHNAHYNELSNIPGFEELAEAGSESFQHILVLYIKKKEIALLIQLYPRILPFHPQRK